MTEKYDVTAFGVLVEHFSFENEGFSSQLAVMILKGLNKANFEEARPFLEAMTYFLNINDSLQPKRVEWVLGFPQPIQQSTRNGQESFGMYGNNSIDDVVYNYDSTLGVEHGTSVLNLILQNRKRLENLCLVCLRQVLILCDLSPTVFEYFISLPPPSYNYANFSDWIRPFIENYIADAKRYYYGGFPKEEAGNEALKLYNAFEEKLNKRIAYNEEIIANFRGDKKTVASGLEEAKNKTESTEIAQNKEESKQESTDSNPILRALTPGYIIGETKNQEKLREIQVCEGVTVTETEISIYITESFPTGTNNRAFPSSIVKDSFISSYNVKPESALAHFIQPKSYGNAARNDVVRQSPAHYPAAASHSQQDDEDSIQEYPSKRVRVAAAANSSGNGEIELDTITHNQGIFSSLKLYSHCLEYRELRWSTT